METTPRNIYNIYQLEADSFQPPQKRTSLGLLLLKSTGIFVVITLIVFVIANYQFIKSQLTDARENQDYSEYVGDQDEDGMPDWWEEQHGLSWSSFKDAAEDLDNDAATNLMEFLFNINPKEPDSDQDGYFDGEEIEKGYNPNGIGRIDTDKDGIYDWWEEINGLNKELASDAGNDPDNDKLNNLEEFKFNTSPQIADSDNDGMNDGEEVDVGRNPMGEGLLTDKQATNQKDEDGDLLEIDHENLLGTDPTKKDTDGDGFDDYLEYSRGYDPTGEGMIKAEMEIPSIGIKAPMVWSQEVGAKSLEEDLSQGIIHYPGTAMPSMRGNSYVTGHSSFYSWSKSPYKEILKNIDQIEVGDEIIFHLYLASGKIVDVVYQVAVPGEVVMPGDPRLFRDFEGHEMTLVSCWPLGTDWKRMMIKADLKVPDLR